MSSRFQRIRNQRGSGFRGNESRGRGHYDRSQYGHDRNQSHDHRDQANRRDQSNYCDQSNRCDRSGGYAGRSDTGGASSGRYNQRGCQTGMVNQSGTYADRVRPGYQRPEAHTSEPDLHQLLEQVSKTLMSLSERVETIEKHKKGPDSHTAAATRATVPTKPAGPLVQKSNNNDFVSISKALYRIVQIGHHTSNWQHLPKSIEERLTRLVEDIKPPMADSNFKHELHVLTQQYGEEVRRLVFDHLNNKHVEAEMSAGLLDPTDVGRAKEVASKYLAARLGKRLTHQRRTELLDLAVPVIGAHRVPPPGIKGTEKNNTEWQVVGHRTPPQATDSRVGTSRKRLVEFVESTNSTPVENRYQALSHENVVTTDETVESDSEASTHSSPKKQRALKKPRKSDSDDVIAEHNVHVFCGDKDNWEVTPESSDISVLVVGDSNLRKVRSIPPRWQVNALPGGDLCHLSDGLAKVAGKPKQYTVVLQAGINHRERFDDGDVDDIRSMLFEARRNPSIDRIYFNGVSIPPSLPVIETGNLEALNRFMKNELGEGYYIAPLDRTEVVIDSNDRFQIHYNQETVDKISKKMASHLIEKVF